MRTILALLLTGLPWPLKRRLMIWLLGYDLQPGCRIGLSLVLARNLRMGPGSRIGHFSVIKLDEVILGEQSSIGNFNWITGFPGGTDSPHFAGEPERRPRLELGDHAAVTHRHIIDCTAAVRIGRFSTMAGFRSQILSHAIDLDSCRQSSAPVTVGDYCFLGTGCILLKGSSVPDRCVLGAGAVLTSPQQEPDSLYAGVPARRVKALDPGMAYFNRAEGYVW